MPETKKILCPDCNVEMNKHAEKIDYTSAMSNLESADPDFGGVLKDAHCCPECGQTTLHDSSD